MDNFPGKSNVQEVLTAYLVLGAFGERILLSLAWLGGGAYFWNPTQLWFENKNKKREKNTDKGDCSDSGSLIMNIRPRKRKKNELQKNGP